MLEALGNLGDFLGGIAVIATLAYLAIQVRQNTKQMEQSSRVVAASAYQNLTELISQNNNLTATDRAFAELRLRGREGIEELDEIDRMRVTSSVMNFFRTMENIHQQYKAGLLNVDQYESWNRLIAFHLSHRGTRQFWSRISPLFSTEFQSKISAMLDRQEQASLRSESRLIRFRNRNTCCYYCIFAGKIPSPIFTIHRRSNLTTTFSESDTARKQENPTRRKH